ncbi:unnamed protein product [Mucor hiemalis]
MKPNSNIEKHIAKFTKLVNIAQQKDNNITSKWFIKSLTPELFKEVSIKLENTDISDLDKVINTARSIYTFLEQATHQRESQGRKMAKAQRTKGNTNTKFSNRFTESTLRCKNHPQATSHDTKDCQMGANPAKKGPVKTFKCRWCKKPAHPGRKCNAAKSSKNNRHSIVPTKTAQEESEDNSGEDNMDSSDSDSGKQFNAITFDPMLCCKYNNSNDFATPPKELLTDKFIYLPIRINKIKYWAFLDTGCNFSIISPALANHLQLTIKPPSNNKSKIKLGHNQVFINRVGSTECGNIMNVILVS